jgi:hypothetical protein
MTNWITYPTTLSGKTVDLVPLEKEHFLELNALAKDERIWEHYPYDGTRTDRLMGLMTSALAERERGTRFTFTIFFKLTHK